ncbi:MAG: hypothetical protein ACLQMO_16320 [Acidobacteriaceae bacterium]
MERKNAFWLSLVFAAMFTCAPILARAAQSGDTQKTPPSSAPIDMAAKDAQRTVPDAYRLTYTLTEIDGSKRVGSQHYQFVLDADAAPAYLNLQSYVPVHIGSSTSQDYRNKNVGVRINANLRQFANGMELKTQVEQDTFANGANAAPATEGVPPITRESFLTSTVLLSEDKPVTIGQLDMPGSTHSLQIQVELTKLP